MERAPPFVLQRGLLLRTVCDVAQYVFDAISSDDMGVPFLSFVAGAKSDERSFDGIRILRGAAQCCWLLQLGVRSSCPSCV